MIKNDDDRVVFFDIDGTLLDTTDFAETARKAAIGLMVDNGLPLDKDEAYGVLKTIISLNVFRITEFLKVMLLTV